MKSLVTTLVAEELSPKTILEMVATAKQIVGSAVDANGNQLFPRTWNSKFIDAPQIGKQAQPCATRADVERCLKNAASSQESLFCAVLAGSGLRVAEALSIHVRGTEQQTSWNEATATIDIRSSIYRGKEQDRVKTQAAIRTVDLDPRLNIAIAHFVAENKIQPGAYLFQNRTGGVMHLLTAFIRLQKHGVKGFHSFRRFRITWLRDLGVPEDIIRYWVGHAGKDITDRYSKLAENVELRKEWARRAGLGFELDRLGDPPPKIARAANPAKKIRRNDPHAEPPVVKRSLIRKPLQQPEAALEADVIVPPNNGSPLPEPISEASETAVRAASYMTAVEWAALGVDVSVSNLTKEELEYYNSGGTVAADRDGVKSTFSRKQGKWTRHEWIADIDPDASEASDIPEHEVFGERRLSTSGID
jgi:hypothetical protein